MSKGYITEQELCDSLKSKFEKVQPSVLKAEDIPLEVDDENFTAHNVQDAIELCVQMCETSCTESKSAKTNSEKFEKMIAQANDKADKAFQSGVDVKNKVVSALASKGFNLTTEKTWEDIVNEINSKKVEKGLQLQKTFYIKTTNGGFYAPYIFKSKHNILYLVINDKSIVKLDNNFNEIWKIDINNNITKLLSKLEFDDDDNIYYSDDNMLCKMNPDGRVLWKQNIKDALFEVITVYKDYIYVGGKTGKVYKLNLDGKVQYDKKITDDNPFHDIIKFKSNIVLNKPYSIFICDTDLNILKQKVKKYDSYSIITDDEYIYTKNKNHTSKHNKYIRYDGDLNFKELYDEGSDEFFSMILFNDHLFIYNLSNIKKIDKNGNLIYSQNQNIGGLSAIVIDDSIYFFDYNRNVNKCIDGISKIII